MKFKFQLPFFFLIATNIFSGCGDSSSDSTMESNVLSYNEIQALNNANGGSQNISTTSSDSPFVVHIGGNQNNNNGSETPAEETPSSTPGEDGEDFGSRTLNFLDGADGNLWKPESDTNGNIVVLFNSSFRTLFTGGCSIQLRDGSYSELYCGGIYSCFTNPNRMTLRSNIRCEDAKEVKVTCNGDNQVVIFTVPAEQRSQVCDRHD